MITEAQCSQRHKRMYSLITMVLVFMGLLVTVGAASTWTGVKVQRQFEVHEGAQKECIKHINQSLKRNEESLQRIESILRAQAARKGE